MDVERSAPTADPTDFDEVRRAAPPSPGPPASDVAPHAAAVAAAIGAASVAVAEQRTRRPIEGHDTLCATTVHGGTALVIGGLFVALGAFVVGAAAGVIRVPDSSFHAPRAVVAGVGAAFGAVGAWLVGSGVHGIARTRSVARASVLHPGEPWRYDRAWGATGEDAPRWGRVVRPAVGTLVFGGFAAFAIRFVAMSSEVGWIPRIVVGVFSAAALLPLWETVRRAMQAVRYGRTYVRWEGLPLRLGERATLRFGVTKDLPRFDRVVLRLRCVEEVFETRSGTERGERTTVVAAYSWFEEERTIRSTGDLPAPLRDATVVFDLPRDLPGTNLVAVPPTYWMLEVEGDAPGLDYRERFLVPVYERA